MIGMLNETIERVQMKNNLKIDSALNDYKSNLLEEEKPHLNEEILYFLEKDLINIKTGFQDQSIYDLPKEIYSAKRSLLEYLQTQRHPINYCVIEYLNDNLEKQYFVINRESGSGETRLVGKKGLLGGHIGKEDIIQYDSTNEIDLSRTFEQAMLRELEEEAGITEDLMIDNRFYGFIKSEEEKTTEYDHLGIISRIEVDTKEISTLEDGIISGCWLTKEEIIENISTFEEWARIVFSNMFNLTKNS